MPANLENSTVATGLEKINFHSNPKKSNAKECSNYCTIALVSHASKVMLKILQARLQQYINHLFLISSASVRSIQFVFYCAHLCMKYFLGISTFLEEISSLSHSIVFLYFFSLIIEGGFLISPCYSLELCIHMGISFIFCLVISFFSFLFEQSGPSAS